MSFFNYCHIATGINIGRGTALKQILDHLENDKTRYKHEICANVENLLMPTVEKLKSSEGSLKTNEIAALEEGLKSIIGRDIDQFLNNYRDLSPRELDICAMVKEGRPSKEIAETLNVSPQTVHKHRATIRRKLKLNHKNINLSAYLRHK